MAVREKDIRQEQILEAAKIFIVRDTYLPNAALNRALDQILGPNANRQIRNGYYGSLINTVKELYKEAEKIRSEQQKGLTEQKLAAIEKAKKEIQEEEKREEENWNRELARLVEEFPNMDPNDYNEEFYEMVREAHDEQELGAERESEGIERFRVR